MITVLCANAGIDRTYEVTNFSVGVYHHPRRYTVAPGGKGINVARVLQRLGRDVLVTGFAGGHTGNALTAMLRADGIRTEFVRIAEESRLCLNIVDAASRTQTQVDEVGPLVSPAEINSLTRQWQHLLRHSELVVIAGSAPRGVPIDIYTDLIFTAKEHRVPVLLDVREPYLQSAVQAGPLIVKPNLAELSSLVGEDLTIPDGVIAASQDLLRHGTKLVLTSLGRAGAIAVTAEAGIWRVKPPVVDVVSGVGSGDAMVAGLVHASLNKRSLQTRLRWAVAAGTANAMVLGAANCTAEQIEALVEQVAVEKINDPLTTPDAPEHLDNSLE